MDRHATILLESMKIIQSSKNVGTKLSRIGLAARSCDALKAYEAKGLNPLTRSPSSIYSDLGAIYVETIREAISQQVESARSKRITAATDSGKLGGYTSAIGALNKLVAEFPEITEFGPAIMALRGEMDAVRFELLLKKSEVQEAKGKTAKAIEYLIEAIMALRHDSTPDHMQAEMVARARQKIVMLGGTPPDI